MVSQNDLLKWKKKRASTYVVFLFVYFLIGMEMGCINATLWIYVSTLLKTDNDGLYYGLISTAFFVPSLFFPPIVTRIVDKTRRVKLCLICIMFLSISGSILYPIHVSPLFPLVGRFLSGFSIAAGPLMISEVARSYASKELMQRIPLLNGIMMFGYAFGPCVSVLFLNANLWIGQIHITYANVIGPFLLIVTVVLLIAIIFFSHDLSREYDMKLDTTETNEYNRTETIFDTIKRMFCAPDSLLIIIISVFFGIADQLIFRVLPLLIIQKLNFSYAFLNVVLVGLSLLNTVLIIVLVYRKMSDQQIYYIGVLSVVSIMITSLLQLLIYHKVGNVFVWYIWIILTAITSVVFLLSDHAFSVVVTAKLSFSCNQGFMEGVRTLSLQSGRIIGGVMIGAYYEYMNVFYDYLVKLFTANKMLVSTFC
ncbi:uncharacterized protein LOC130648576 [Hydractinia symbiolongicarpus]|uniref:uncharacterized protein LOC130648576 n=1 Tax=Hydractinia symbiolongicarpus TaxID=13093 RepID=UPI00254F451E|nr:uncharacterized protein LOC130648576 [Hydractinia symbiolongicarpus]